MDKIKQYYKICDIKPEYYNIYDQFTKPSRKKIVFNGRELELYYVNEFGTYVDEPIDYKVGGSEKNKIICLDFN